MHPAVARLSRTLAAPVGWLVQALFPCRCVSCGTFGAWCCPACLAQVWYPRTLTCPACGVSDALGAFCPNCRGNLALRGVWAPLPYGHPVVRELLRAYKYEYVRELEPVLVNLLAATLRTYALPPAWGAVPRNAWVLCPVPLAPKRLRSRGFNQTETLARALAERTNLAWQNLLERTRSTKPQSDITDHAKRMANVQGAFCLSHGADVRGRAVILLDDVYTSGSTLEACAAELRRGGAAEVWGLAVAKG